VVVGGRASGSKRLTGRERGREGEKQQLFTCELLFFDCSCLVISLKPLSLSETDFLNRFSYFKPLKKGKQDYFKIETFLFNLIFSDLSLIFNQIYFQVFKCFTLKENLSKIL